jgi:hypothetical protein
MARSTQEIFDTIQAEAAAQPVLSGLAAFASATGLARLWAYITAKILQLHEQLWERHKADVDAALAKAKPGTADWHAEQALLFQLGDVLIADDNGIHYAAGSTGARIITRASAKEDPRTGKLFIKVAKDGPAAGTLAPLTNAQKTQVIAYFDRKGFAGVRKEIVSLPADMLKLSAAVYYDALIDVPALQLQVQAAVRGALAGLEFNGELYLAKLQDAIQAVAGVKDVQLLTVSARVTGRPVQVITRVYETVAGYIVEDTAAGSTLVDTIQYLPYAA